MIQVNELRIGNWVNFDSPHLKQKFFKVDCLSHTGEYKSIGIDLGDSHSTLSEVHANGIPLTPEILEKAGFKQAEESNEDYYILKPFAIKVAEDRNIFILSGGDSYNIKSLHQLQNLYFALTRKELEINLNTNN